MPLFSTSCGVLRPLNAGNECHVGTTDSHVSPPPPGLEKYAHLCLTRYTCCSGTGATSSVHIHLSHGPTATGPAPPKWEQHQHQTAISCFITRNPGPRNPTNIIAAACGEFHAVILQEASDHVTHMTCQFIACIGDTDPALLLIKDTFELDSNALLCRPLTFWNNQQSHFARHTSLMSLPRIVTLPLINYNGFMGTLRTTMSTS